MTIEGLLIVICILLTIMGMLLFSGLKGIANIMEQQGEIFKKQSEWMGDVYDIIFQFKETDNDKIIVGDEDPKIKQNMFEDGMKHFDKK